jgi:glycosyltransferase involved in cell wall biosynthesis
MLEMAARIDPQRFHLKTAVFVDQRDPGNAYLDALRERGVDACALPTAGPFDRRVLARISELVREESIDMIHAHDYKSDILTALLRRRLGLPVLTTCHGWITTNWKRRAYIWAGKQALRFFDAVIAVSPAILSEARRHGVSAERAHLVHNAIVMENYRREDFAAGYLRERFGLPEHARVVGYVGRLSPEKGQVDFVEAWRRVAAAHADAYCVFVGDGPDRPLLERQVREAGLGDRVLFAGYLSDPRPAIRDLDWLALTSHTEGFPNVLLEALSLGVPVLAAGVGGVPDIVDADRTGLLVEARDLAGIASALDRALSEPGLGARLAEAGREKVLAQFQFSVRVERIQAIYEQLAAGRALLR